MRLPDRLGFRGKTLWDWLQLLIVPAILIGVTFVWSATQTRSDNKREDGRVREDRRAAEEARQDATLQSYLDQMSHLMLDKKLLSKPSDPVRSVARTVTLTALRRLDGERKAEVARFLSEAKLLGNPNGNNLLRVTSPQEPLVALFAADLSDADLRGAFLPGIDFSEVNLSGADLRQALLWYVNLSSAHLSDADLQGAQLSHATLNNADLRGARLMTAHLWGADASFADLRGAKLAHAKLGRATLTGAKLRRADLTGADLKGAHLGGADLTDANLTGADISGATFSDHDSDAAENAGLTKGLDLSGYLADRTPQQQKHFLDTERAFLNSLARDELSKLGLTPETLAKFRRDSGSS